MQPFAIVHLFDKVREPALNVLDSPVVPEIDLFSFQGLHETFGHGIVIGVAFAGHADLEPVGLEGLDVLVSGVLHALVRVVNHPLRRHTGLDRHGQGVQAQGGIDPPGEGIADRFAGASIQNHRQVHIGGQDPDSGNVGHPDLVDRGDDQMPDPIGIAGVRMAIVGGAHPSALGPAEQAVLPHEAQHLLVIDSKTFAVEVGRDPSVAVATPLFDHGLNAVTVAQLDVLKTDKTRVLLLNSPSNPTGMIYTSAELTEIGNWAVAHDVLILADDIYGRLVYNGNNFTPISTLSDAIKAQTIIINGVSKTYAMTGWRIGFAVGNPEIIGAMSKIASQTTSNPSAVAQYAAIEALTGDQSTVETMRLAFEERLNTILPLINEVPGFEAIKPQGAFYLFPKVAKAMEMKGFSDRI